MRSSSALSRRGAPLGRVYAKPRPRRRRRMPGALSVTYRRPAACAASTCSSARLMRVLGTLRDEDHDVTFLAPSNQTSHFRARARSDEIRVRTATQDAKHVRAASHTAYFSLQLLTPH